MLTPRENLIETIRGGKPDRFVKQFEPFALIFDPIFISNDPVAGPGEPDGQDDWGVTWSWPEGQPGAFPVHHPSEKVVVKDIANWRDYVRSWPQTDKPDAAWEWAQAEAEKVDRSKQFVTAFVAPGIFEQTHDLCEITNTFAALYEEPEALKDLIEFVAEKDLRRAEVLCEKIHPDAVFHHDDWGSQLQPFMSNEMFCEFLFEPYQRIYNYYREHGVQLVVHHSDSNCAAMVPLMIDMGIDIWQGPMKSNDLPTLIEKYGGQISFMGGIENGLVDRSDWDQEKIDAEVFEMCSACGPRFYIPCLCAGSPESTFDGVYDAVNTAIDKASAILMKK